MASSLIRSTALFAAMVGIVGIGFLTPSTSNARPVQFGQIDQFQDGTTAGWGQGSVSPTPTTNVATGGPAGTGDRYILNSSSGQFGAGGKQILFNTGNWSGNYIAAGVTRIDVSLRNLGSTDLAIRLALAGGEFGSSRYSSTNAVAVPASGAWMRASFTLDAVSMTSLGATSPLSTVLTSVVELRILSAAGGPAYNGDTVASHLGIDDIRALRLPGDATFDNVVNFNDLLALAQNYNTTTGATWHQGDFDFNGAVNFNDLLTLAQNYNSTGLTGGLTGISSFDADWALAQTLVPEPTAAVALLFLARRRR
jgi:hypothetical protein